MITQHGVPCPKYETNPRAAEKLGFLSVAAIKKNRSPDVGRPDDLLRKRLGGFKANASKNEAAIATCSPAVVGTTDGVGSTLRYTNPSGN